MPYLLKTLLAPVRMRDGKEAGDPIFELRRVDDAKAGWVPFRNLPASLTPHDGGLPGNVEIAVQEITQEEYDALDKPEPVNRKPAPQPAPPAAVVDTDGRRPARAAMLVPPEDLERHMVTGVDFADAAGDAFERDVDESATEPHDAQRPAADGRGGKLPEDQQAAADEARAEELAADDDDLSADADAAGLILGDGEESADAEKPTSKRGSKKRGRRGRR